MQYMAREKQTTSSTKPTLNHQLKKEGERYIYVCLWWTEGRLSGADKACFCHKTESPFDIVIIHDVAEKVCVVRHS